MGTIFGMEVTALDIVVCSALCCLAIVLNNWGRSIPKGYRLPPGPPQRLIIGNFMDMPTHHEWETVDRWADEYGDLVCVKIFNSPVVYVNSAEVARDLFDKRSSIYSDRTDCHMIMLMGWTFNTALLRYGQWWRRHRRVFHTHFHPEATKAYLGTQTKQVRKALQRFRDSPDDFFDHLKHITGAIIMEVIYGTEPQPKNDRFIYIAEETVDRLSEALVPGSFLVDMFPILKYVPEWMPGASFQTKARISREMLEEMQEKPFKAVKDAMSSGIVAPSVLAFMLNKLSNDESPLPDEEVVIKDTVAISYAAAATTTTAALRTFILAMVLYPDTQSKAQAELDSVVGIGRPVDFENREDLPYTSALCKEIMRWRPVLPFSLPHCTSQDDIYGDYFIPKGTVIMGNAWRILRDEKVYGPRIEEFYPERFLDPKVPDPIVQYGFGRRTCPGRYMANNTIWITVASLLQSFTISHAIDESGNKIPISGEYRSGAVTQPTPFKCSIKPRSPDAEKLLSQILNE